MDTNRILALMVLLSAVSFIVRAVRVSFFLTRGWVLVNVGVLIVLVVLHLSVPDVAGWVSAFLWAALILVPSLLQQRMGRFALRMRFGDARRIASVLRWLHPFDGYWQQPRLYEALDLATRGYDDRAAAILESPDSFGPLLAPVAKTQLYWTTGAWEKLARWVEVGEGAQAMARNPSLIIYYLRSLGELHRVEDLVIAYERARPVLSKLGPVVSQLARLVIVSFGGGGPSPAELLRRQIGLPETSIQLWHATALFASGRHQEAEGTLKEALATGVADPLTRKAMERRLLEPPPAAVGKLSLEQRNVVLSARQELMHEEAYRAGGRSAFSRARVTYSLIALNCLAFTAEVLLGGSMNEQTLARLGAVVPDTIANGEYWRFLAATFLHFGFLHLSLNMFALFIFGPFLEMRLKALRFLGLYLAAGVCSMGFVAALYHQLGSGVYLVGASGSIMGLVGATGVALYIGYRKDGARPARSRLTNILLILFLQTVFDLLTPQVSFLAHFSGALTGALLAAFLTPRSDPIE